MYNYLKSIPIICLLVFFFLFLYLVYDSYTEETIINGYRAIVSRGGNPLYGLIAALLGDIIFLYLHFKSKKSALAGKSSFVWLSQLAGGSFIFILSLLIPAKSLGYFVLFSYPVGIIFFIFFWLLLFLKIKKKKNENLRYFYTVSIGFFLALFFFFYFWGYHVDPLIMNCCH